VLTLTNATADTGAATPAATSTVKKSDVDNAKTIAIVAIVVGALGFLFGIGGLARGRRKTAA